MEKEKDTSKRGEGAPSTATRFSRSNRCGVLPDRSLVAVLGLGNPQVTGPGHAEKSLEIAQELAAQPDAAKVFLNKAYRTMTGNPLDSLRRPDSTLLSIDETVTAVEVPSKSDNVLNLA